MRTKTKISLRIDDDLLKVLKNNSTGNLTAYIEDLLLKGLMALSRNIAKSGNKPVHQKTNDTERYVEIANTSHSKGELKFTHREPN